MNKPTALKEQEPVSFLEEVLSEDSQAIKKLNGNASEIIENWDRLSYTQKDRLLGFIESQSKKSYCSSLCLFRAYDLLSQLEQLEQKNLSSSVYIRLNQAKEEILQSYSQKTDCITE